MLGGCFCFSELFESCPDLYGDLPVSHLTLLKMGAGLDNLKPAKVFLGERSFGNSILDGILNAEGGRTDEFDFLIGVIAHDSIIRSKRSSVHYPGFLQQDAQAVGL